jgi:hypothetical protein
MLSLKEVMGPASPIRGPSLSAIETLFLVHVGCCLIHPRLQSLPEATISLKHPAGLEAIFQFLGFIGCRDLDADPGTFFTGGVPSLLFCFEDAVPFEYKRLKTGVSSPCVVLGVGLGRVDRVFRSLTAWASAVRAAALCGFLLLEDRVCVLYKRSKTEPALALGVGALASRLTAAVFDVRDELTVMVTSLRVGLSLDLVKVVSVWFCEFEEKRGVCRPASRARKLGNGIY